MISFFMGLVAIVVIIGYLYGFGMVLYKIFDDDDILENPVGCAIATHIIVGAACLACWGIGEVVRHIIRAIAGVQ